MLLDYVVVAVYRVMPEASPTSSMFVAKALLVLVHLKHISVFTSFSITDPFIFSLCHKEQGMGDQACSRYAYSDIKEIHLMRFLLQVGVNMPCCLGNSCKKSAKI